jgi:type IV secretory pathway TrbL component
MKACFVIVLTCVLLLLSAPAWASQPTGSGVETITSQFTNSAKKWETTIKGHAVKLFWILAAIAAVWTFAMLVLRQADLADLFGAVTRFTFVTFFFYWVCEFGPGYFA